MHAMAEEIYIIRGVEYATAMHMHTQNLSFINTSNFCMFKLFI